MQHVALNQSNILHDICCFYSKQFESSTQNDISNYNYLSVHFKAVKVSYCTLK